MIDTRRIIQGDCLEKLKELPDESVDCCITSPPYYGLRDYGTGEWVGGNPNCKHFRESKKNDIEHDIGSGQVEQWKMGFGVGDANYKKVCPLCGAVRIDKQIGLEETPEQYIERLTQVFHEVKRVLKKDGTLWVNIGDTYNTSSYHKDEKSNGYGKQGTNKGTYERTVERAKAENCKAKDLIGIPWMLAFSLRADGWYLRQDIIWHKPNPTPEPVKDRCTKSHEYIFLFSKSPQYYFDYEAIQEDAVSKDDRRSGGGEYSTMANEPKGGIFDKAQQSFVSITDKRNKRDVWSITPSHVKDAHFATYPEELVEPCVLAGSRVDGVVLDPFFGSGTTGRVAERLGRNWIGIELNPKYVDIAKKRTNDVQTQLLF